MSDKPAEILVEEFLAPQITEAAEGTPLHDAELHDTLFRLITKPFGVRIGEATSQFAPVGGGAMKEFNAKLFIVCFAEITGTDKKDRKAALQKVFDISQEVARIIVEDSDMGGTVCDVQVLEGTRGYDRENDKPYAVANIPIVVNQK